jgi:hypothetical protein
MGLDEGVAAATHSVKLTIQAGRATTFRHAELLDGGHGLASVYTMDNNKPAAGGAI